MSASGVRWRYLRLLMGEVPEITRLDALGDQGWEVVGWKVAPGQIGVYEWLFKRMVLEHPAIRWEEAQPETEDLSAPENEWREPPAQTQRKVAHWSDEARARARERGKAQAAKRKEQQDAEPAQQAAGK